MNPAKVIPTLAVALCGALAALPIARGQNGGSPAKGARSALKIAVVDMGRILQQYKKAEELRLQVAATGDANNAKLKELFGKGKELAKTLQDGSLDPESKEFRETETKVFQLESYLKTAKTSAEKELRVQGAHASLEVYNDIQETLKVFCERNGFTIIFRVDNETAGTADPQNAGRVLSQEILYHEQREDITNPVIAYLNRRYESSARPDRVKDKQPPSESSQAKPSSAAPRKSNSR